MLDLTTIYLFLKDIGELVKFSFGVLLTDGVLPRVIENALLEVNLSFSKPSIFVRSKIAGNSLT